MKCQNCGTELKEGAKFCPRCGTKTEQVQIPKNTAYSHDISAVWPEWKIEKQLGKGSYGVVYQAMRNDNNVESHAAIKVISIPTDASEVDSLRSEGMDANSTRDYFKNIVNDFIGEIRLMESLKGMQNIVSVEDYKVIERTDTVGWDIYIRMELLTPFTSYISDKTLTEEEVIKLGCDICSALEICAKSNVIHRDIKPENIFINKFGYYKLGDFGIARELANVTGAMSHKGTFNYIAPEVVNGTEYDARVDLYSLGIVLYRMLNGNRLPFINSEADAKNPNTRREAVDRRIRGEKLPAPCNASPEMADVVLRACAFDKNQRFSSAVEMKNALISVANHSYKAAAKLQNDPNPEDLDRTVSVRRGVPKKQVEFPEIPAVTVVQNDEKQETEEKQGNPRNQKKQKVKKGGIRFIHIVLAAFTALVLLAVLCLASYNVREFVLTVLRKCYHLALRGVEFIRNRI